MKEKGFNHQFGTLFQQVLWASQRGVFDDPLGQRLLHLLKCGIQDDVVTRLTLDKMRPLQIQAAMGELPPFKAAKLEKGQIRLGTDLYGKTVRLVLSWLLAGLLLVSNTGGGKSNLITHLVLQIAALGCPVWLSETYKTQLRRLRPLFRQLGVDLIILRLQDWCWNLLQSHLRDPQTHLALAVDLLMRVLDLPPRARSILVQGCYDLYKRFGIWRGRTEAWPTLFDLHEWVRMTPGLNPQARYAILDRLSSLLLSLGPRAAYRRAWNPADLARFSIDFEMRGISETVKHLLLESLVLTVFQQEVDRGVHNGPLKLVIAFDDAQRLFDAANQSDGGEIAPLDELAGLVRAMGISLWAIVQTMYGLSPRLTPNLATKIAGRMGDAQDYARVGATQGWTAEQVDWTKLHLKPGMFVGQVSEGDCREPFVFTVPLVDLSEAVEDAEAEQSVKALDSLPTVFADEFAHWQPQPVIEVEESTQSARPKLSELELRYLKAVVAEPNKPSSFYCKTAHINGQRAAQIRQRLITDGFVSEHALSLGIRGRHALVLEPLEPAFAVVATANGEERE